MRAAEPPPAREHRAADVGLVIFDCDGVLVDSEVISNCVLAELLTAEGLPTTLAQSRREYQGLLLGEVSERAEERLGHPLPDGWLAHFERERAQAFRRELAPVAGAAEVARQVKAAGIDVCVASQGKLSKTNLSLSLTGLDRLFPECVRFSAESVARGKPAPDLFLHAARAMGADPAHCMVVEDTPSGVEAAVSAGMRVLGFAADSDETALRDAGAQVIRSLGEVLGTLDLR